MSKDVTNCIDLKFSQASSTSRRAKARDLWTFLDSQSDLKPYLPPTKSSRVGSSDSLTKPPDETLSDETTTREDLRYPWYNQLRRFQRMGLDKIALAADNTCSDEQSRIEKNIGRDEYLADMVDEPYDMITTDLQAFDERVEKNPASSAS